jgi:hypothetical protein
MPIAVLAETIIRVSEDTMTVVDLGNLLARGNGLVELDDLEERY